MSNILEIDARGHLCPVPVLRLQKQLSDLPPGAIVRLLADDPMAGIDVPHFCAQGGHSLLSAVPFGGGTAFSVAKRA